MSVCLGSTSPHAGCAVFAACPDANPYACLAVAASPANPDRITNLTLQPGIYHVQLDATDEVACVTGTLDIARHATAATGDDCTQPWPVAVPAGLPATWTAETTCGRGDALADPTICPGIYSAAEDFVVRLDVTAPTAVELTLDPHGAAGTIVALLDDCPATGDCLAFSASGTGTPHGIPCTTLDTGTYFAVVDANVPGCLPIFDLTIAPCSVPVGACCVAGDCVGDWSAAACHAAAGVWYPTFTCDAFVCPVALQPADLGEDCAAALAVPALPYAARFTTAAATADGPPGDCNDVGVPVLQNDVWFRLDDAGNAPVDLVVEQGYFGVVNVYSGDACGLLVEEYCVFDPAGAPPVRHELTLPAQPGVTRWVQVGDWGAIPGGGDTVLVLLGGAASPCAGDANCDGFVNFQDIPYFLAGLGDNIAEWHDFYASQNGGAAPPCDFVNCDVDDSGNVNFQDIPVFLGRLGVSCQGDVSKDYR
jgi:hypothetical protein